MNRQASLPPAWLTARLALLVVASFCSLAHAEAPDIPGGQLSKWPIDAADPAGSMPSEAEMGSDPMNMGYLLMDLSAAGEQAMHKADFRQAIKYFKTLQKLVPDRAISFAKECECQEALGQRELAVLSCKTAMNREGVRLADAARYVRVLSSAKGGPTPNELVEIQAVLSHLRKQGVDEAAVSQIECDLAVERDDLEGLKKCSAVLEAKAPGDPRTVSYLWALAAKQGNYQRAKALLARAKQVGVAPAALEKMLDGTRQLRWAWFTGSRRVLLVGLLLALVAGILVLFGRRARTQAEAAPQPQA